VEESWIVYAASIACGNVLFNFACYNNAEGINISPKLRLWITDYPALLSKIIEVPIHREYIGTELKRDSATAEQITDYGLQITDFIDCGFAKI
jgi:hypothetical protein